MSISTIMQETPLPNATISSGEKSKRSFTNLSTPSPFDETPTTSTSEQNPATVSDLFLKTDLHGLPDLWESCKHGKFILSLTWTIVLLLTSSILIWQLYISYVDFLDRPILTTYGMHTNMEGIELPDVYICPLNRVHAAELRRLNVNKTWYKENAGRLFDIDFTWSPDAAEEGGMVDRTARVFMEGLALVHPMYESGEPLDDGEYGGFLGSYTGSPPLKGGPSGDSGRPSHPSTPPPPWTPASSQEFFLSAGYPLDTLFNECQLQSNSFECRDYITELFDDHHGKCFLLRLNGRRQLLPGMGITLSLDLDGENAYNWPNTEDDLKVESPLLNGILVKFLDRSQSPLGQQSQHFVRAGGLTNMILERQTFHLINHQRVPSKLGDQVCYEKDCPKLRKLVNLYTGAYTRDLCTRNCLHLSIVSNCSCLVPCDQRMMADLNMTMCSASQMHDCVFPTMFNDETAEMTRNCSSNCLGLCDYSTFRTTTSFVEFAENPRKPGKNKHKLLLQIAYETLTTVEITQENSMTFTTMVGNMGGHVGLWLGASMISVVKVGMVLVLLLWAKLTLIVRQHGHRLRVDHAALIRKTTDITLFGYALSKKRRRDTS